MTRAPRPDQNRDDFQRGVINAPLWFTNSSELEAAALALYNQLQTQIPLAPGDPSTDEVDFEILKLHRPYQLLVALAIETRLKALIVAKRDGRFDGDWDGTEPTALPADLKRHDLVELSTLAELQWRPQETDFLRRMSQMVVWQGRYPIPVKVQPTSRVAWEADDHGLFLGILERISKEYRTCAFAYCRRRQAEKKQK